MPPGPVLVPRLILEDSKLPYDVEVQVVPRVSMTETSFDMWFVM